MTMKGNPLRGAVAERFGSCEAFAKELNWSGRKARAIVSGRQQPTAREITQMARALDVMSDPATFMLLFFPSTSTM